MAKIKKVAEVAEATKEEWEKRTLVIRIDGWLGRVIAMTGVITEVAKTRPVKVITSRPLAFWWNPYIVSVHWLWDRRIYEDVIKGNLYFELEPYTDDTFFNDGDNWLDVAAAQLSKYCYIPREARDPVLFLAEHEKLDNVLDWHMPILFQPFGSTMQGNWADKSYRSFRVADAQYIADELMKLWYTVYVAEKADQPKLKWCIQLTVDNLRRLVTLCARYPVLWCDSSLHHAAKAFGNKAVVVRAWTDAWRFWYNTSINLRNDEKYEYVPFRLGIDFDTDIQNQKTNIFTKEFLDNVIKTSYKLRTTPRPCSCTKKDIL